MAEAVRLAGAVEEGFTTWQRDMRRVCGAGELADAATLRGDGEGDVPEDDGVV